VAGARKVTKSLFWPWLYTTVGWPGWAGLAAQKHMSNGDRMVVKHLPSCWDGCKSCLAMLAQQLAR